MEDKKKFKNNKFFDYKNFNSSFINKSFNADGTFNSSFKVNETLDKKETEENVRYVESKVFENFIQSKNGLSFLIEKINETKISENKISETKFLKNENILGQIDFLIDYYTTWTSTFPVRKNLKISKYDFLKTVEDFCSKSENAKYYENIENK